MKLLVVNESKGCNIGDKAIHKGMEFLFEKVVDEIDQLQLSFELSNNNFSHKGYGFFSFLKRFRFFYKAYLLVRVFVYNFKRFGVVKDKIKSSDYVIFGGGSLLINNFTFPLNLFFISSLCHLYNKNYAVAGVSTRAIKNRFIRMLIKKFIKGADFVYVRDHHSKVLCKEQFLVNADYAPDFALCLEKEDTVFLDRYRILINVMGLQSHGFFSTQENVDNYILFLKGLVASLLGDSVNYSFSFFTTGEESDRLLINKLRENLNKEFGMVFDVFIPNSLSELLEFYKTGDIVIATRLHSAIIGLATGHRVVCFNWDSKVEGFFDSLSMGNSLVNLFSNLSECIIKSERLNECQNCFFEDLKMDVIRYGK